MKSLKKKTCNIRKKLLLLFPGWRPLMDLTGGVANRNSAEGVAGFK